ncbi:hypothetical protein LUZ60_012520 [Juncus effusus]|nr:hypothetical protein LUZ60_012520 [Juncus effusus]
MASSSSVMHTQDTNNSTTARDILILLSLALGLGFFFTLAALFWECCCCRWRRQNNAISNEASIDQHNNNRNGLSLSSIASLPTFEYKRFCDDNNGGEGWAQCSVCLNMVQEGEKVRQLTDCKHFFHPECIDTWLYSHSTCPLCRNQVPEGKNNESRDASSQV